jgi:hypothetical protein
VLAPFAELVNPDMVRWMSEKGEETSQELETGVYQPVLDEVEEKAGRLFGSVKLLVGGTQDETLLAQMVRRELEGIYQISVMETEKALPGAKAYKRAVRFLKQRREDTPSQWLVISGWLAAHRLGQMLDPEQYDGISRSWIEEWMLTRQFITTASQLGLNEEESRRLSATIKAITAHQGWFAALDTQPLSALVGTWLADADIQELLGVNRYKDVLWFNKESFEEFLWWLMLVGAAELFAAEPPSPSQVVERLIAIHEPIEILLEAEAASDYQVNKLLDRLHELAPA